MTNSVDTSKVIHGHIVNFRDDPSLVGPDRAVENYSDGALVVSADGHIAWLGSQGSLPEKFKALPVEDYGDSLLMAGFIDTHIHYPQYRMLAAPGVDLMDWLKRFTFKEEALYGDTAHAKAAADHFLNFLISHGTTSAMAYSSVHAGACEALFQAAETRGMALISGKTMMDRNAPSDLLDTAEQAGLDTQRLIVDWHNKGRLRYAITPRFAVTSSEAQLDVTGELYRKNPDCYMQTHLSESLSEIDYVKQLYPWAKNYTAVYDRYGLLGKNSFFGHGVHLSEDECQRLSESNSKVVHCPTSNMFLGSGLANLAHLKKEGRAVSVSLGSDVGGGTSYSMLSTIGEAYKVCLTNGIHMSAYEGYYMATLGNARALGLESEIGSLSAGCWADFVVMDQRATPLLQARQDLSETLEDMLFALAILGDDRAIKATYVAGERLHKK